MHSFTTTGPITLDSNLHNAHLNVTTTTENLATVNITSAPDTEPPAIDVDFNEGLLTVRHNTDRQTSGGGLLERITKALTNNTPAVTIDVTLPEESTATLVGRSGSINVTNLPGLTKAAMNSGKITVDRGENCSLAVTSGKIEVDRLENGQAKVTSGKITINHCGNTELKTTSGKITVEQLVGTTHAKVTSGNLHIARAVEGSLTANVTSGNVFVGVPQGTACLTDVSSTAWAASCDLEPIAEPDPADKKLELTVQATSGKVSIRRV